jgi:hypothetical protein
MYLSRNKPALIRIEIDIALFLLAILLPWWCSVVIAIIALFFFNGFVEAVILGIFLDSLYNAPVASFHGFQFIATSITLICFLTAALVKTRLRFYS